MRVRNIDQDPDSLHQRIIADDDLGFTQAIIAQRQGCAQSTVSQVLAAVGCVAAVAALVFLHFRPHDPEKLAERVYARKLEEKAATEKTEQQ